MCKWSRKGAKAGSTQTVTTSADVSVWRITFVWNLEEWECEKDVKAGHSQKSIKQMEGETTIKLCISVEIAFHGPSSPVRHWSIDSSDADRTVYL